MNKNKKVGLVVLGVIVLIGAFYGGMVYGKGQTPSRGQAFGQNGQGGLRGARNGGGFTAGEIISKDDKSITVKLMNRDPASTTPSPSGSKIIFLGTSTTVTKTAAASVSDLTIGAQVSVTGTANTDGSVNASTIQIRPNMAPAVVK